MRPEPRKESSPILVRFLVISGPTESGRVHNFPPFSLPPLPNLLDPHCRGCVLAGQIGSTSDYWLIRQITSGRGSRSRCTCVTQHILAHPVQGLVGLGGSPSVNLRSPPLCHI